MDVSSKSENRLSHEQSLYLRQHAGNPVDWYAWGEEPFLRAREENKLVVVSIGYASCHWCHVMAHECFENREVADFMNRYFINVKVDREERPDIDSIYTEGVQLLGGRGGWPLNCVLLPNRKMVWGTTYLPVEQWLDVLQRLVDVWLQDPESVEEQGNALFEGVSKESFASKDEIAEICWDDVVGSMKLLRDQLDGVNGGIKGSPKFPLPGLLDYILSYQYYAGHEELKDFLLKTLQKMSNGGIYDQLAGGFARYSVDEAWKIPHFEKMLYDNAQMGLLYAEVYALDGAPWLADTANEIFTFILRDMALSGGGFGSSWDADSEGEEGLYYTWTRDEVKEILGSYADLFCNYYGVDGEGLWEDGRSILLQHTDDEQFVKRNNLSLTEWKALKPFIRRQMLQARRQRTEPTFDDKVITSWNAMTIFALARSAYLLDNEKWLEEAVKQAEFIRQHMFHPEGGLWRIYRGNRATTSGLLEDYAHIIRAWIMLYQCTGMRRYLIEAELLSDYVIEHFPLSAAGLICISSGQNADLMVNKPEVIDQVVPSSAALMAHNLFILSLLVDRSDYRIQAEQMAGVMVDVVKSHPVSFYYWGRLIMDISKPFYMLHCIGDEAIKNHRKLMNYFLPGTVITYDAKEDVGIEKEAVKSFVSICSQKACLPPVNSVKEVLKILSDR